MQNILQIIGFSKNIRKNVFLLHELVDIATELRHVVYINRRINDYHRQIQALTQQKPSFIARIELRSLRNELKLLRNKIASKTTSLLNGLERAA